MSTYATNRSMPACTVIPVLAYEDAGQASDWLCAVFGFTERLRVGNHRAQLIVGGGAIMVRERRGGQEAATPDRASTGPSRADEMTHSVLVRVEDVNGHHDRARERGARILQPPADYPYGERQYSAEDLGGHRWTFSQSVVDVAPEEWGATVANDESEATAPTDGSDARPTR